MKNLKKGFTLVELIVVIVILAILATIAFISLRDWPVKARDGKRVSEIGTLADKANIILADNSSNINKLATGTPVTPAPSVTLKKTGGNIHAVLADINYDVLWVDADAFTSPNWKKEKYRIIVMTWSTADGKAIKCFEIWAMQEITSTGVFTKGNCGVYINEKASTLFSRNEITNAPFNE